MTVLPSIYHSLSVDVRVALDSVLERLFQLRELQGVIWGGSTVTGSSVPLTDIDLWAFFGDPKKAKSAFLESITSAPGLVYAHDVGALRWFGYLVTLFFSPGSKFGVDVGFTRLHDLSELNTGPGYHVVWAAPDVEAQLRAGIRKKSFISHPESRGGEVLANLVKLRKSMLAKDVWNALEYLARARRAVMGLMRDSKPDIISYYERPERGLVGHLSTLEQNELMQTMADANIRDIRWAAIRVANLFLKTARESLSPELSAAIKEVVNTLAPASRWLEMPSTVGLIGAGRIGCELVRHLTAFEKKVLVVDINPQCEKRAEKLGAVRSSLGEVKEKCAIVLLSLPTPDSVEAVLHEIITGPALRKVIIDTSTNAPDRQIIAAQRCHELGHGFVEAPLSGGLWGAREGTMTVMVGGLSEDVEKALPVLNTFAKNVIHVGPSGHGAMAKLIHNMVGEIQVQAFAEAFTVGALLGLDLNALNSCMATGMVASRILTQLYARGIFENIDAVNVTLDTAEKDQRLLLDVAEQSDIQLTFSRDVHRRLVNMQQSGLGGSDVTHTLRWFEQLHNVSIDIDNVDKS